MTRSTAGKLGLLTTLYLSQGLPFGFFTQALPVLLREQKASLTAIGFTGLLAIPWVLKFLWAPFVDRTGWERVGRRRSWILPMQLLAAALLVVVATLDPATQLPWVLVAVLFANLFAATQDVATDGLAVSLLTPKERGLGNGVQVSGYRVGMIIGGGLLLINFDKLGWSNTFLVMAGIMALASVPVGLYSEPPHVPSQAPPSWRAAFRDFYKRDGMRTWLALLVAFKLGDALSNGMIRPMLVDRGLDLEDIGWMLGLAGFFSSIVGAMTGGWLTGRIGRHRALLIFGLLQATGALVYVLPAMGRADMTTLYGCTIYENVVGSMATAAIFTAMMDAADEDQGGTDYTIQASVFVLATGLGSTVSGVSADLLGYTGHFVLATVVATAGALIVWRWYAVPMPAKVAA